MASRTHQIFQNPPACTHLCTRRLVLTNFLRIQQLVRISFLLCTNHLVLTFFLRIHHLVRNQFSSVYPSFRTHQIFQNPSACTHQFSCVHQSLRTQEFLRIRHFVLMTFLLPCIRHLVRISFLRIHQLVRSSFLRIHQLVRTVF